jgi:hypothetical protein
MAVYHEKQINEQPHQIKVLQFKPLTPFSKKQNSLTTLAL